MSDKLFRTLTIGGVTYTLNDTTKLEKPTNNGTTGQILVKTDEGSMWQNPSTAPDGDFVTQDVFDQTLGDINSILDEINGEEV